MGIASLQLLTKVQVFERQIEDERQQREALEKKLGALRSDYEEQAQDLETTTRRLRDAEELADTHSKEATTHREALMVGLAKLSRPDSAMARDAAHENRVNSLQEAIEKARELAKSNQEAADAAAQKLRSAEERIAGLDERCRPGAEPGLVSSNIQSADDVDPMRRQEAAADLGEAPIAGLIGVEPPRRWSVDARSFTSYSSAMLLSTRDGRRLWAGDVVVEEEEFT